MVRRIYYIVFLCLLCYCMCSCAALGIFPRERLLIDKKSQIENIDRLGLKINGVYVGNHKGEQKKDLKAFFILFSNGLCHFFLNWSGNTESVIDYLGKNNQLRNDSPIGWGVFDIQGDTIDMAHWRVMDYSIEYNRLEIQGKILDSETIVIEKGWGFENETVFHFYPLKNKPDSTNRFIK